MTAFYEDELISIYNGDWEELPAPTGIDLLLLDPPFDQWRVLAEKLVDIEARTVVVFTTWQHREALEVFGRPRAELVWTFDDGRWVSHSLPRVTHETILVYGQTREAYVGRSMAAAMPSNKGRGSVGRDTYPTRTWRPRARALLNSHLAYPRDVGSGVWTKPVAIMEQLIEWLVPDGGLVFDPFCGAGSVLVAAKALGRRAVGFDIDPKACAIAAARCSQETLPATIWDATDEA